MKLEVVEDQDTWIVRGDGQDLARHRDQDQALADAAERLRHCPRDERSHSFTVRYLERG
ncbi:MAG: hypothetical protein JSR98_11505 [Proteobacteria bacterium]|nr:hypothetical protein [Pseudomonadota bacterium]